LAGAGKLPIRRRAVQVSGWVMGNAALRQG